MLLRLPYGNGWWEEELPQLEGAQWLEPAAAVQPLSDLDAAVMGALQVPLGAPRLCDRVRPGDSVAIVVSDATRRSPTQAFLDGLSVELDAAGVTDDQVTVVVATGTHRSSTQLELLSMLGERHLRRFSVVVHDCQDDRSLRFVGETPRGIPVWVNRAVADASVRILTGAITPHHLCGYSGGRKSLLPGVCGAVTVARHHSFPIRTYQPVLGKMAGQAAHEEALAAARLVGIDLILNAVPNPQGPGYLGVIAGDLEQAHEAGVDICNRASSVVYDEPFDLTICSPGGHPRDMNLHQAQKALTVAEMLTRAGGAIVLVAACGEGFGSSFAPWLQQSTPQQVLARFAEEGWSDASGKAMMFARALCDYQVFLVTELGKELVESIHLHKADSISEAWHRARSELGPVPRVAVVPRAASVIPVKAVTGQCERRG